MKRIIFFILSLFLLASCCNPGKDKAAYRIFGPDGSTSSYSELLTAAGKAEIILFGETHNCPIAHWLEYELTKDLFAKDSIGLVIGAEMFEADNQDLVDAYLSRDIDSDEFEEKARLWDNYYTDYYPLLFFAKDHGLRFVATNVPRSYAAFVKENGLEALAELPKEEQRFIAPLPIEFTPDEDSKEMFAMMKFMMGGKSEGKSYYAEAQAVKDATMAWFISQNFERKFIHYNGNFHSDMKGGIIPYLEKYLPGKKILTVCSARQDEINALDEENLGRADFILCVPTDMTTTF